MHRLLMRGADEGLAIDDSALKRHLVLTFPVKNC